MLKPKITTLWTDLHNRHIIEFLATHNPALKGRALAPLWKRVANSFQNDHRGCTVKAWQSHYNNYKDYFIKEIEEYIKLGRHPEPPKLTFPIKTQLRAKAKERKTVSTEEKHLLISFLAVNDPHGKGSQAIFRNFVQKHPLTARRSPGSWYQHYLRFKDWYRSQIEEYRRINNLSATAPGSIESVSVDSKITRFGKRKITVGDRVSDEGESKKLCEHKPVVGQGHIKEENRADENLSEDPEDDLYVVTEDNRVNLANHVNAPHGGILEEDPEDSDDLYVDSPTITPLFRATTPRAQMPSLSTPTRTVSTVGSPPMTILSDRQSGKHLQPAQTESDTKAWGRLTTASLAMLIKMS
ncbi:hypothetical protein K435DRAFT_862513 [Dendrothele bispora CBS 962.96]|uniref:Uncharacterized protein n=1 Tax=Dendrothele bispora (strain CBS 962.96) TaxID=1314807 RepID=A0A4S8LSI3_DENBC|nr:hypothetical protein K435DRAFT_862513 [Dendrothele bispora CBS 962.96]